MRQSISANFQSLIRDENKLVIKQSNVKSIDVFRFALLELKNISKATSTKENEFNLDRINDRMEEVFLDLSERNSKILIPGEKFDIETNLNSERDNNSLALYASIYQINPDDFNGVPDVNKWRRIYAIFLRKHYSSFNAYFDHFYSIVKYIDTKRSRLTLILIDENRNDDELWKEYISFLVSPMTQNELTLLFYQSLLYETQGQLYRKYNIFDGLVREKLFDPEHVNFMKGVKIQGVKEHFIV